jgi:hypothetical protein
MSATVRRRKSRNRNAKTLRAQQVRYKQSVNIFVWIRERFSTRALRLFTLREWKMENGEWILGRDGGPFSIFPARAPLGHPSIFAVLSSPRFSRFLASYSRDFFWSFPRLYTELFNSFSRRHPVVTTRTYDNLHTDPQWLST